MGLRLLEPKVKAPRASRILGKAAPKAVAGAYKNGKGVVIVTFRSPVWREVNGFTTPYLEFSADGAVQAEGTLRFVRRNHTWDGAAIKWEEVNEPIKRYVEEKFPDVQGRIVVSYSIKGVNSPTFLSVTEAKEWAKMHGIIIYGA